MGADARHSGSSALEMVIEGACSCQSHTIYQNLYERTLLSGLEETVEAAFSCVTFLGRISLGRPNLLQGAPKVDFIVGHRSVVIDAMFYCSSRIRYTFVKFSDEHSRLLEPGRPCWRNG